MNDEIRLDQCHSEAQADRWVNRQADKWSRRMMIAAAIAWAFVLALVVADVLKNGRTVDNQTTEVQP
jgi:hypothetical protein